MDRHIKTFAQHLFENKGDEITGCIMFTDVKGSSELWRNYPESMKNALFEHNKRISTIVGDISSLEDANNIVSKDAQKYGDTSNESNLDWGYYNSFKLYEQKGYGGLIVKTIGDAFMVSFEKSKVKNPLLSSIQCAIDIQKSLIKDPIFLSEDKKDRIKIRIGIAYGPMNKNKLKIQNNFVSDYHGNTVNTASRMESKVAIEDGVAFSYLSGTSLNTKEALEIRKLISKYPVQVIDFLNEQDINDEAKKSRQNWLGSLEDIVTKDMKPGQFQNQKLTGSKFAKEIAKKFTHVVRTSDSHQIEKIDGHDLPDPIILGDPEVDKRSGRLLPNIKTKDRSTEELNGVGPLTAYSVLVK